MTTLITLTTASGSYFIDIALDNPVYRETLLPTFNQLGIQTKSISLTGEQLISLKIELQRSLENHISNYQPEEGRGREKKIFGKNYFLTLLSTEHNTIAILSDVYDAVDDCVQNGIALQFEYSK